jgi:hypothetical protein
VAPAQARVASFDGSCGHGSSVAFVVDSVVGSEIVDFEDSPAAGCPEDCSCYFSSVISICFNKNYFDNFR